MRTISIIGDGGWGTTLAIYLARKKYPVFLWGAFPDYVSLVARTRENKKFLPGYKIPRSIVLTADMQEAVSKADLIVLACPSEYLVPTLNKIKSCPYQGKNFLSVIKGIHPVSFKRMSVIVRDVLGPVPLAVLSGPTIARELAAGIVTTAVVASGNQRLAGNIQNIFSSPIFRIYTNTDVIGVEIGGSVKNVIALACGVCDGLGLGTNAKAAILTRGLAEITRLGTAMGGRIETFYGLSGLGDLATTCFSPNSRNRMVGQQLGEGKSIRAVLKGMSAVAEGIITAKAVYRLSKSRNIPMPIVTEVYKIIAMNKNPRKAMADLMGRSPKPE
jgi:glycerol-3-phosphate dehydrogenase (NAD(P)+)